MSRLFLVALLALALVPMAGVGSPGSPILAGPGAWISDFATKVAVVPVGGELSFVNADLMRHDVVADGVYGEGDQPWCAFFRANECPLFWSPLASMGETVGVEGLDRLAPATTYAFYCTLHPQMKGTLVAVPDAAGSE